MIINPYIIGSTPASPRFLRSQVDGTNGTGITYNFTGSELPAEKIAVAVHIPGASGITIDSVTIGGATGVNRLSTSDVYNEMEIWDATPSTGNSGTISVVASTALATRCSIGVWSVVGLTYQTGTIDIQNSSATVTLDVNTSAGDFVICYTTNANTSSVTPSGYTEDFDEVVEASTDYHEGGHNPSATGGTPEPFSASMGTAGEFRGMSAVYR